MGNSFSQLKYQAISRYQSFLWKTFEVVLRWRVGWLLDTLWLIGARTLPIDTIDGTNPLMHYSLSGDEVNVDLLASRYRNQITSSAIGGQTALHAAATSGSHACCITLCENGADINKQSDRGHTALMIACSLGHIDVAKELLRRGAKADMCDIDLKTAQHFSVKAFKVSKLILKETQGKLLSARDTNGKTPLMIAIMLGGEDEVFELLMDGIDEYCEKEMNSVVNIQSNDGMTALMHASQKGLSKATLRLIKAGSDVSLRDAYGQTSLHLAAKARQVDIVSLLLKNDGCKGEQQRLHQLRDDDGLLAIHSIISGLMSSTNEAQAKQACECMSVLMNIGGPTAAKDKDFSDTTALHLLVQTFFKRQESFSKANGDGENVTSSDWYIDGVCQMIKLMTMWRERALTPLEVNETVESQQGLQEIVNDAVQLLLTEDESGWTCYHYMYDFIKGIRDDENDDASHVLLKRKQPVIDLLESFIDSEKLHSFIDIGKEKQKKSTSSKYLELRGAYHRIPLEERDDVLRGDRTLKGIADRLLRTDLETPSQQNQASSSSEGSGMGPVQRVVVLCGAGISTSAGIPDYRSDSGIYKTKAGRDAFSCFHEDPMLFWDFARKTFGPILKGEIQPTASHKFLAHLHKKNMLQRVYTQNVDGLEIRAGVPKEKLIQCHGSITTVRCSSCAAPSQDSTPAFFPPPPLLQTEENDDDVSLPPLCEHCSSPLRPDVTFFGEPLTPQFFTYQNEDFDHCTLLIVMGTTLQVFPFASLVSKPPLLTPRLLMNKELTGPFRHLDEGSHKFRDVAYVGTCDDGVKELGTLLGWKEEEWL